MNRTSKTNIRRRHRSHAANRGAAMVEGIVIISGMLMFLGLIVWSRNAWGKKVDLQMKTRADSLYYASHACKDKGGGSGGAVAGGDAGSLGGPNVAGASDSASNGKASAAGSSKWGKATATASETVTWKAAFNVGGTSGPIKYSKVPLVSKVQSASEVLCNEPKYDNQLLAWAQFAINMATSGGGMGGLL